MSTKSERGPASPPSAGPRHFFALMRNKPNIGYVMGAGRGVPKQSGSVITRAWLPSRTGPRSAWWGDL